MKDFRTITLVVVAAAATVALAGATTDPPVGQQAKEFKAVEVLNMRWTKNPLHTLKGRVVLFTNFESWYERCEQAVEDMNKLHDKYGPKGLTILAYGEQEKKVVEPWIAEKGVRFSWALIDTPTKELFRKDWPAPGMPWSYLIDATGKIVWQENPRNMPNPNVLKPGTLEPLLVAVTQAPYLPKALSAHQKLLDDGLWAQAKKALLDAAAAGTLDKSDAGWAKGVAAWIDQRHDAYYADAEALCKKGEWWDAWDMMNDFPRKFEGMEGAEKATAKAAEIRAVPEALNDLKMGDDVVKAKEQVLKKNWNPALLILKRLAKDTKGTRHYGRVNDLLELVPQK